MKRIALVSSLLATAAIGVQAQTFIDNARVRSVEPQYESVSVPREVCTQQMVNEVQRTGGGGGVRTAVASRIDDIRDAFAAGRVRQAWRGVVRPEFVFSRMNAAENSRGFLIRSSRTSGLSGSSLASQASHRRAPLSIASFSVRQSP